ncbi:hypothetical protein RRG08_002511 [Elysia crispata]|uniref:Uncharacterized protein n=1 Tax=Elysia crispata TaxID=231223 RepID=A0AAE1DU84_9GAST|nr:hypothetical protein RRG08_002511 [Elysia crispata]
MQSRYRDVIAIWPNHGGEDDFIEEQVEEDEMDKESDSEEDTIPRIDPRSSDEHSEDDEHHNPSTTRYGLLEQRDGGWCFNWLRQS